MTTETTTPSEPPSESHSGAARRLVDGLVAGDLEQVTSVFSGPADIDDPFDGRQIQGGFEAMVANWGPTRHAEITGTEVTHTTIGGGHCGVEITLHCRRDGTDFDLPIVVVADLDDGRFRRTRIYYRRRVLDLQNHFRDRLLPEHEGEFEFLPAIVEYQAALRAGSTAGMLATFGDGCYFDGHGESQILSDGLGMGLYEGKAALQGALEQMFGILSEEAGEQAGAALEHVNAFSDGVTTILEFNIVHRDHPTNRVHAGVSAYELGPDGLIHAARVYDEHW